MSRGKWKKLKPFCGRGHALSGDNLYLRPDHKRECKACRNLAVARLRAKLPTEIQVRRLLEAARSGLTINNITRGRRGKTRIAGVFVMHRERLNVLAAASPQLGRRLFKMLDANKATAWVNAGGARRRSVGPSITRATANDIMDAIEAAVPRHLPKDHRDDVIQNIWVDVTMRKFPRREIAMRAPAYIRAEYRASHNRWGDRSLDVPIWFDSSTTLLDTISTEQGLWR